MQIQPRSFDQINQLVALMKADQAPQVDRMREVLMRADGDWILPMPELKNEPKLAPMTPMLIGEAVDQLSMRAASRRPMHSSPALKPNERLGRGSQEYAMIRRKIISGTYGKSRWNLGRRRYFRHLAAYHQAAVVVAPYFDPRGSDHRPVVEVRDPFGMLVEPRAAEQLRDPLYGAFLTRHSGEWIRSMYPKTCEHLGGPITEVDTTKLWDIFEWYDEDQICWGLLGPVDTWGPHVSSFWPSAQSGMQLSPMFVNKAGMVPMIAPRSLSLGGLYSRLGALIGNVDMQARLMALGVQASVKSIYPDTVIIGAEGKLPQLVNGEWKSGESGDVNMLMDAQSVQVLRTSPDQGALAMVDRLERNFRTSTGLAGTFGGENSSSLRTGRAIDALTSTTIDVRIQELHEIDMANMEKVNEAILATWKGYWPRKQVSFHSSWPGDSGLVEFKPSEHIETTENVVTYPFPGADIVQLTQILGSLLGTGTYSKASFREYHPYIDNPDLEGKMVEEEQFAEALLSSTLQQIAQGQLPLMMSTMIHDEIADGHNIYTALKNADTKAKAIQASQAPPPPPEGGLAPEGMPGLAAGPAALQPAPPAEAQQQEILGNVSRQRQLLEAMGG